MFLVAETLRYAACSLRREFAEPARSGHAALHEEVAYGDECLFGTHQQLCHIADLVRRARTLGGATSIILR
jgi:hypothetical protein